MYVSHAYDTGTLVIFLSWSMGLFVWRWGVCGVWTGEAIPPCRGLRYQSRKTVGRMERVDATGGFWGSGGWLLFHPLHQDPLKRSLSRLIRHGSRLFPLIGYGGKADVGGAAGGLDNFSSSLSHCGMVRQHQHLSHTTCWSRGPQTHNTHHLVGWLSKTDTHLPLGLFSTAYLSKMDMDASPQAMFTSEMCYGFYLIMCESI